MKNLYFVVIYVSHAVASTNVLSDCPPNLPKNGNLWSYSDWCFQVNLWNHHGLHNHDWFHARDDCRRKGGELIHIRDADMQDFIRTKLLEQHYDKTWRFWIGASDREHEGKWQWLSEPRETEYSNWSPGQGPDQHGFLFIPGGGTEDCAVLDIHDHAMWHDYPCSSGAGFWFSHICQFRKPPVTHNHLRKTSRSTLIKMTTKSENPHKKTTKLSSSSIKSYTKTTLLSSHKSSKLVVTTERQTKDEITSQNKQKLSSPLISKSSTLMEILSTKGKPSSVSSSPGLKEISTMPDSKTTRGQTLQRTTSTTPSTTTTKEDIGIIIG